MPMRAKATQTALATAKQDRAETDIAPESAAPPRGVVEFRGLVKRFPGKDLPALQGVSGRLERGDRVALLGANGSGKTTLLRILATVLAPDEGNAAIAGYDVVAERGRVRKRFGVLIGSGGGLYRRWRMALRLYGSAVP